MSPDQQRIKELERQVKQLTEFMLSFDNPAMVSPLVKNTIVTLVGAVTLDSISDVSLSSPTNGQVLEYLNGLWVNATDNV